MCLRYTDNENNDRRVSNLLNSTISSIQGVVKVQFITLICVNEATCVYLELIFTLILFL